MSFEPDRRHLRLTLIAVPAPASAALRFSQAGDLAPNSVVRCRALVGQPRDAVRIVRSPMDAASVASTGLTDAVIEPALADREYGAWTGQPISTIAAAEPDLFAQWLEDVTAAPAGGESIQALVERARRWLERLAAEARTTVAITHPPVIRACLAVAVGHPKCWFTFDIGYATRSVLTWDGSRWRIALVNSTT